MSVDTSALHSPLYDEATDGHPWTPSLDVALDQARRTLAEKATANIHDPDEMIRAAVGLEMRLRQLIAALDQEAGR
ncbi:hypothetical protein [Streptomyces sp. HNA39]|uniref:hypothetical protein n=1 Tax=Streptomyces sp. HNA39 TaxID=2850561 RepID=UPI00200C7240|nr:hypothetical protein [Streptomyces sp. HNA39]UQA34800.1 hypothetical protein KRR37_14415 [Streptomyces sp. HNA39]